MTGKRQLLVLAILFTALLAGACSSRSETKVEDATVAEAAAPAESASAKKPQKIFKCTSPGQWFPANPTELAAVVDIYLDRAEKKEIGGRLVALISPHAGYQFSAEVAAYSYKLLEGADYDTVVVVGISHHVPFSGIAVYPSGAFRTPLGDIPIDSGAASALVEASDRIVVDESIFSGEHSVDNQLPFLQRTLKNFKLLPVILGRQSEENINALAEALPKALKGRKALLVASTDMSHFWPYEEANELDREMIARIEEYDIQGIRKLMEGDASGRRMCGHGAVRAVMAAARSMGADSVEILKHANSQDTYGPAGGRGVVGYLAAAIVEKGADSKEAGPMPATETENESTSTRKEGSTMNESKSEGELGPDARRELLGIARRSLEAYVRNSEEISVDPESPELKIKRGMFVTLEKNGRLRGCMGHFENDTPIGRLAAKQVLVSAFNDPRFPAVAESELDQISIEISVLSVPEPVDSYEDIVVGKHGVILEKHGTGATFLPQVAPEQGWDRDEMLTHLAMKARLPGDAWKSGARFKVYTAEVFSEEDFE